MCNVLDLIQRCERAGGSCEVSYEEFLILLKGDARINGIRNLNQQDGKFKSQCRIETQREGETNVFFFTTFTDAIIDWQNP